MIDYVFFESRKGNFDYKNLDMIVRYVFSSLVNIMVGYPFIPSPKKSKLIDLKLN